MFNKITRRISSFLLALAIFTTTLFSFNTTVSAEVVTDGSVLPKEDSKVIDDYDNYLKNNSSNHYGAEKILPLSTDLSGYKEQTIEKIKGIEVSARQNQVTYTFDVNSVGSYNINVKYYALPGKSKEIVFSLKIDNKIPFKEAENISFKRVFVDDGKIKRDTNGNDLRPTQTEFFRWNESTLKNTDGYYDNPYEFEFSSVGKHTVTFTYSEESFLIASVELLPVSDFKTYKEYSKQAVSSGEYVKLYEAESSFEKSSSMLYPTYDRSSAATSPNHFSKIRYNTIGQSNWSHHGQWISWKISVPKDGWYNIALKARQNYQQGINSYRTLYIDGEIPFKEVKNIEFPYSLNWYMKEFVDEKGTPYLFYLSKGEHELKLEVAAGPMGSTLKALNDSVLNLNKIYRSIIMVTGATPDKYRTYYLEESIPNLFEDLQKEYDKLNEIYNIISKITGAKGSQASVIKEMSVMIEEFIEKPLNIPERVSSFKGNIESLGSLILTLSEQALELDYIAVYSNSELPEVKAGFFEALSYGVKGFLASFVEDYNSIGSSSKEDGADKNIRVWISSGRDQAQILKNLIDNKFTQKNKISVALSIVATAAGTSSSTLVQATLAGKGPDVALYTPKDTPVNLAMRNALVDLSKLEGFEELKKQFYESAWIPYEYEGGVYAVPETQNFDMLFCRTDILEELGLTVPNTWQEFYSVLEILQKNNLGIGVLETNSANAGISSGISFFEKILLQNGGTYYTYDLKKTRFTDEVAYKAFEEWTELYTDYGLDRSFDFFNRFRTGEMPIGIMSYTQYNQLYAAAPEIRGLWEMALVPGTVTNDGTVLRTETAAGTSAIMLDDCKDKNSAWKFIKWWVDSETQASYGTELEATLGIAARYDTANVKAFEKIGWTDKEAEQIKAQWENVTDIKQIPGNYFISRCLTNAFRSVVDEEMNPVRALNTFNKDMNAEITRKRKEFGLD